MSYCPECGGDMQYIMPTKRHVCKSCGLSLTRHELAEMRRSVRNRPDTDEEKKKQSHKDYLKWWLSKKG